MKTLSVKLSRQISRGVVPVAALLASMLAIAVHAVRGQTSGESLERQSGTRVEGRIRGECADRLPPRLPGHAAAGPVALEAGAVVHFEGLVTDSLASPPPLRVLSGAALRLSGTLQSVSPTSVHVGVSWQSRIIMLPRPGVQAVVQRTGEARLWFDDFETLEKTKWTLGGKPELVEEPHLSNRHSLRLPAEGSSLVRVLDEPLAAGRFDLAIFDDGTHDSGRQWFIELTFMDHLARRKFASFPAGRRKASRSSRRVGPPCRSRCLDAYTRLASLRLPIRWSRPGDLGRRARRIRRMAGDLKVH